MCICGLGIGAQNCQDRANGELRSDTKTPTGDTGTDYSQASESGSSSLKVEQGFRVPSQSSLSNPKVMAMVEDSLRRLPELMAMKRKRDKSRNSKESQGVPTSNLEL
jgi:hypothetical protein